MSAINRQKARREYLQRLEREDIARNAKLKAYEQAQELVGWRKLANAAIETAEISGADARSISFLRDLQDELVGSRTDKQWQELNERLGF